MNSESNQREVEEVMESIIGIQRAEAPPFLFTRIEARLRNAQRVSVPVLRWAVVSACVLVALNVGVLLNTGTEMPVTESSTEGSSIYGEGGVNYQLY